MLTDIELAANDSNWCFELTWARREVVNRKTMIWIQRSLTTYERNVTSKGQ